MFQFNQLTALEINNIMHTKNKMADIENFERLFVVTSFIVLIWETAYWNCGNTISHHPRKRISLGLIYNQPEPPNRHGVENAER